VHAVLSIRRRCRCRITSKWWKIVSQVEQSWQT